MHGFSIFRQFSLAFMAAAVLGAASLSADTIHLANGFRVEGTVDEAASDDRQLVVKIGDSGRIWLLRSRVLAVEPSASSAADTAPPEPVPAVASELVTVVLEDDAASFYTRGKQARGGIVGVPVKTPHEEQTVLEIPGAGRIKIANSMKAKTVPTSEARVELATVAATGGKVSTSHLIHLTGNRRIRGNVIASAEDDPLIVQVGSLGRVLIDRSRVISVEKVEGTYELPQPPEEPVGPPPAEDATTDQPPTAGEGVETTEATDTLLPPEIAQKPYGLPEISLELAEEIEYYVRELTRQRTQNRVRAENHLRRFGALAVPYLDKVASHPFDLTRRAVMRLVRDAGHPAGTPMAINALIDEDLFVRIHAEQALEVLLDRPIDYDPRGSEAERRRARRQIADAYYESIAEEVR